MGRNARAIQEIKARLNLVDIARRYVDLKRNGPRWVAPCPFHQETKPSFSINEEEGFFYCFGCQASGDLFDFYGQINGLDFKETLEQLAEEAGVTLERGPQKHDGQPAGQTMSKRRQLLKIHEIAAAHFTENLSGRDGAECRDYMARRGISEEVAKLFGLGWSRRDWQSLAEVLRRAGFSESMGVEAALLGKSERGRAYDRFRGRLMFPIRSLSGNVIAFGGRIIANEDEAKYINSSDSQLYKKGEHLYGLQQARRAIATGKPAMLTEGYMDVVTLHQFIHRVLFKFLPKIPRPRGAQNQMGPKLPKAGQRGGIPDRKGHDFPVSGIRPHGRLGLLAARVARKRPRAAALNDPLAQLAFRQPQAGAQCGRETADEFGQFNLPEKLARPVHGFPRGHIAQATHAEGHALRRIPAQILKNVRSLRP